MPSLTPLTPAFAARVEGIDAASASEDDVAFVRKALLDHCVLVLPGHRHVPRRSTSHGPRDAIRILPGHAVSTRPLSFYEQIGRLKMEVEWLKKKVAQVG